MKYETIISGLKFPEGPVFDFEGNLWFVEIKGGNLSRWDGKELIRYDVDGTPNGAMIDRNGHIWFCDSGRGEIRIFNPSDHSFRTVCNSTTDSKRLIRPNDLIFDRLGNLIFSDHADGREQPLSTICALPKGDSQANVISKNKYFTNGLAFRADGKTLIFAETYRQQLWTGKWDAGQLELREEQPFARAGNGPWGPDGMAFDDRDNLYVAVFNESCLQVFSPDGQLTASIPCLGSRPTSCAFDPFGKLGLVVTEADRGEIIVYPELKNGLPIFY